MTSKEWAENNRQWGKEKNIAYIRYMINKEPECSDFWLKVLKLYND